MWVTGRWARRIADWFARRIGWLSTSFVASVWLVHGLVNKLLHFSPRHLQIVQSVPGLAGERGEVILAVVGVCEVGMAVWVLSGWTAGICASVQTVSLLAMNVVELTVARPLLLWPAGLIPINLAFLGVAWVAASSARVRSVFSRGCAVIPLPSRRISAHCLTLTYALPPEVLRPLLPPGLELDTYHGYAFLAVALVQTESLRPAFLPTTLGQDFFLAGYRIFTRFTTPGGQAVRGLRILRSDADRSGMVVGGNLLTHYNYHRCDAEIAASSSGIHVAVHTTDGLGSLEVTADLSSDRLPAGSPFRSVHDARRFAGPLPFTFDYEHETNSIIAIRSHAYQLAPCASFGRRFAYLVLRPSGVQWLHADAGSGVLRPRYRLLLGARRAVWP